MQKLLRSRYGGVVIFYLLFTGIALVTRISLLAQSVQSISWNPLWLCGSFLCGFLYDLAAASYASLPLVLFLFLPPNSWFGRRWFRVLTSAAFFPIIYLLLFGAVAEWFFWEEFSSRFNFIAVDYLIYTTEVIGNIRESYPMPLIFGGLLVVTALVYWGLLIKTRFLRSWYATETNWNGHRLPVLAFLAVPLLAQIGLTNQRVPEFGNAYNQELARNGLYAFFAAYRENSLDYERFYPTLPIETAFQTIKPLLGVETTEANPTNVFSVARPIRSGEAERHWNVIQITVESLSAKFLGCFGNTNNLTPNLDRLFHESLVFTNLYATGTRTVRGMEALTLCVPPTPGQSIVRRPNNDNLFTVGSLFRNRGYDTAFIYSGFGYFDNMNAYFAANGYRVIDRASVEKTDITYATIWGACDGDLFRWTMREADAAFAAGKPFHHFVMTTSNHRPFGFPDGCIDLPTGNREGAVKYTDYAIGKFLEEVRAKAWFTNTIFVVVGDHCASAAGKTALPIDGYYIPAFVWNPGLVPARQVGMLCSQIDLLPTIIGMMNWSYESQFYGKDVLRMQPHEQRTFISTYQRLGYLTPDKLAVLEPVRRQRMFKVESMQAGSEPTEPDTEFMHQAISQYQTASYLFAHQLNRATNAQ